MDRDCLLDQIEKYLRDSGIPASQFGKDVLRDPMFVTDLRRGRDCRLKTVEKVLRFMREHPAKRVA